MVHCFFWILIFNNHFSLKYSSLENFQTFSHLSKPMVFIPWWLCYTALPCCSLCYTDPSFLELLFLLASMPLCSLQLSPPQSLRPPLWVPKFHSSCSVLTLQVLTDNLIHPHTHYPQARFWESSSLIVPFKVHPCLDVLTLNPLYPKCVTPTIHSAIVHLGAQCRTSALS